MKNALSITVCQFRESWQEMAISRVIEHFPVVYYQWPKDA